MAQISPFFLIRMEFAFRNPLVGPKVNLAPSLGSSASLPAGTDETKCVRHVAKHAARRHHLIKNPINMVCFFFWRVLMPCFDYSCFSGAVFI